MPSTLPMVGDRRKCYQVLLNLASNAVKFTERGCVRIEPRARDGLLDAEVQRHRDRHRAEQLRLLFEPFRQLDGSPRRLYEGTGLGLHLSRKLLDLMGGNIGVEADFGAGSRFSFAVPLGPCRPHRQRPLTAMATWPARPAGGGQRGQPYLARFVLERGGLRSVTANNGMEGSSGPRAQARPDPDGHPDAGDGRL